MTDYTNQQTGFSLEYHISEVTGEGILYQFYTF